MQSRVARRLPVLVTVSQSAKRDIVAEMGVDAAGVLVVPVGVDTALWRPLPEIARVPGRIMTTASADIPLKGLAILLEALAKLRTERDEAHLVVIGKLREKSPIAELISHLGLADAVEFVSGESDESLVARYASSSVAVVPSLYEGFSLPAIEAMACGVPLVCSNGGALPEVVGAERALGRGRARRRSVCLVRRTTAAPRRSRRGAGARRARPSPRHGPLYLGGDRPLHRSRLSAGAREAAVLTVDLERIGVAERHSAVGPRLRHRAARLRRLEGRRKRRRARCAHSRDSPTSSG